MSLCSHSAKAVLLDSLGTLLELSPPAPLLAAELSDRFGVELSEQDAERAIAAEIAFYRAHLDEGRDLQTLAELRRRCSHALREALPATALPRLPPAEGMVEALLASLRFRIYPDVVPALRRLRESGLRLVVASNWDVSLHQLLRSTGLAAMLDGIVTSAEAGARKPSRAIFEQALALARARPDEAIHVGDTLEEDVAGARAAGIEPVLLRRDGSGGPADVRTIADLRALSL